MATTDISKIRVQTISIHSIKDSERCMVFVDAIDLTSGDCINFSRSGKIYADKRNGQETLIWSSDRLGWDEIDPNLLDAAEKANLINTQIFLEEPIKNRGMFWMYKGQIISSNMELSCILQSLGAIPKNPFWTCDPIKIPDCCACQSKIRGNLL